jgi:DNA-binding beta-propeller fold protein YncE
MLDVNGTLRVRAAAGSSVGRLLGVADDGTLQAQPALSEATAAAAPLAPSSLSTVPTEAGPLAVAVHPAGTRLFVLNTSAGNLQAFDVSGNGRPLSQGTVPTGSGPTALALDPAGTRAYVLNAASNTLQAYSLGSGGVPTSLGTVATGSSPKALALNATGTLLYVLTGSGRTLQAYETTSSGVPTSLGAGVTTIAQPQALALNPAGTRAYVLSNSQLETFDLSSSAPVSLGAVPSGGLGLAVNAAGTCAYVSTNSGGQLQVFDLSGSGLPTSLGTVAAGTTPQALALSPAGTRAYVLDFTGSALQTLDLSGAGLPTSLGGTPTSGFPQALALNPTGTRAYVVSFTGNTLQTYQVGTDPPLLGVGSNGALAPLDPATLPGVNLLPQAYGSVGGDGTDFGSAGGYTIVRTGAGKYRLSFAAGPLSTANLANAVVTATLFGGSAGLLSYNGGVGYLDVFTFTAANAAADRGFSFSLYLP